MRKASICLPIGELSEPEVFEHLSVDFYAFFKAVPAQIKL